LAPPEFEVRDLHALAHWLDGRQDTESADEV
jgi:hypothetical protein